ncbi:CII family transcriptional regulator [Pseudomonas paraeruginosa]|uniref:CII family transcriptional regulator n=1 Tax=Pseudomonas paraeruginosa TaxID=2994495 RepID=UPI002A6B8B49|nr:CII family transcriptional regulator [Pseudomonas paraeruginosa]MDY1587013.1 CII family transcriptional regulator [Pseudomonas paraeruginosa]
MTASQLNPERDARAREFESLVLNRLLSVGQKTVADAIGVSESTVSRWKEGEIERWCKVLALLDLQVVPMSAQCHPSEYIQALKTLAELGLQAEKKRPGPLGWD